jgi:hydroxyethylthiazole kinase-like uncharacterized protein yjeF
MPAGDQILTVAQMRAAEEALLAAGETVDSLMERAGRGAADWIWRAAAGRPVTVLCGPGNNGGDGYVIAESLRSRGSIVSVQALAEPKTGAAQRARSAFRGAVGGSAKGGVFVDCLFGSGLARPLGDELAGLVRGLARSHSLRIAVDLPSGVSSDDGAMLDADLPRYELTIALGAWKFAHWLMPAMDVVGTRKLVDLGVRPVASAAQVVARPRLRIPPRDAHKYRRGLLAVVGGAMPGAGVLAARSAMHGGAGYVKLLADPVPAAVPDDLVVEGGPLRDALGDGRMAAVAVGPGLGRDLAAQDRLHAVLERDLATLCDADGLMLLRPQHLAGRKAPLVLTPHAGELTHLLEVFGIGAQGRLARLRELTAATAAVVVAKGPDTIVAAPGGRVAIAPPAPSWLSAAGTGDVLAGLIASRMATGREPFEAACEGVWLHGEAARRAGPVFTAGELVAAIPSAYAACL